tara:strand:+ start:195 stop:443 length:249 start_codon:yes stop_codon:yes gene_type:complete
MCGMRGMGKGISMLEERGAISKVSDNEFEHDSDLDKEKNKKKNGKSNRRQQVSNRGGKRQSNAYTNKLSIIQARQNSGLNIT